MEHLQAVLDQMEAVKRAELEFETVRLRAIQEANKFQEAVKTALSNGLKGDHAYVVGDKAVVLQLRDKTRVERGAIGSPGFDEWWTHDLKTFPLVGNGPS